MASDKTKDFNAQERPDKQDDLHGGTQRADPARQIDPEFKEDGTPATVSPSGGVHPERPGEAVPRTKVNTDPQANKGPVARSREGGD